MSYAVYQAAFTGIPRDHLAIFVETNENGKATGFLYHVIGNIQQGMQHDHKPAKDPAESVTFVPGKKDYLGKVSYAKYPRVLTVVNGIPPPKKQFDGPKRMYPEEPLRRCREWAAEAIEALRVAGVLEA